MNNKCSLSSFFSSHGITEFGILPFTNCRIILPRLLEREKDFIPRSALLFLVPYYAGPTDNISVYAAARDYHGFFKAFGEELTSYLKTIFPSGRFLLFSDHSPIDERGAAAQCGLGFFGKNHLLINRKIGSFFFIGEVISDISSNLFAEEKEPVLPKSCEGCGRCLNACPTGCLSGKSDICLSALTQKKGTLTEEEESIVQKWGSAWGCDFCQFACPYNIRALKNGSAITQVPYFKNDLIFHLDSETVLNMSDEEFASRAFAWRGKAPLLRNLKLLENPDKKHGAEK